MVTILRTPVILGIFTVKPEVVVVTTTPAAMALMLAPSVPASSTALLRDCSPKAGESPGADYPLRGGGKGNGRIRGTVRLLSATGTPVSRCVWLLRDVDLYVLRKLWSDPFTGAYDFKHVDETVQYMVLAKDYSGVYDTYAAGNLTPELMPA